MARLRVAISTLVGLCLLAGPGLGQTTQPVFPPLPAYADSVEGLTRYFKDMLVAAEARDVVKVLAMWDSMMLPKSEAWFKRVFGEEMGAKLEADYREGTKGLVPSLTRLFLSLDQPKSLLVSVIRVDAPDDAQAKAYQVFALSCMKDPVSLYAAAIRKPGTSAKIEIWSIVYQDGAFRYVGKMEKVYRGSSTTKP